MTCTLDLVLKEQIDKRWNDASALLEKACERCGGRYDANDIRKKIRKGEYQLWLVMQGKNAVAALVAQLIFWPKLKEYRMIIFVGSGIENWLHLVELVEKGAKKMGCAKISGVARMGWEKMLKNYRKTHVFLERDL